MARPAFWDDVIRRECADGRVVSHGDLLKRGVPRNVISGLVARGVLTKESHGLYVLSDMSAHDPFVVLARKYGGTIDEPKGILCLRAATILHELTDVGVWNVDKLEIALSGITTKTAPENMDVRILRWKKPYPAEDIEWRCFGVHGIHLTTAARTVCDLYAPWVGALSENMASEALGRLMIRDIHQARRSVERATELGWGGDISRDFQRMQTLYRFTEVTEDNNHEFGSIRL